MREVDFDMLTSAANEVQDNYTYQFQSPVDGDFTADTCKLRFSNFLFGPLTNCMFKTDEAQLYQKRFNFSGPLVKSSWSFIPSRTTQADGTPIHSLHNIHLGIYVSIFDLLQTLEINSLVYIVEGTNGCAVEVHDRQDETACKFKATE